MGFLALVPLVLQLICLVWVYVAFCYWTGLLLTYSFSIAIPSECVICSMYICASDRWNYNNIAVGVWWFLLHVEYEKLGKWSYVMNVNIGTSILKY